jgi:uncharacterized protein (DUF1684 family)
MNNRKNSTRIVIGVAILFLVIIVYQMFTSQGPPPYDLKLMNERTQKDGEFRTAENSPIPTTKRKDFDGLEYFPPLKAYVVEASLDPKTGTDTIILQTTKGTDRKLLQAGTLSFTILKQKQQLSAFRYLDDQANRLFIPFKDLSSGKTTYAGGRYLETIIQPGKPIVLDFNRCYNPYCVYNEEFVCPIPPLENKLRIEVLAGEMKYEE